MLSSGKVFARNLSTYYIGLIFNSFISFISIPLIVNFYGIESYGRFTLIQNVIFLFVGFGGGGLIHCIIRFNDNSTTFELKILQLFMAITLPLCFISFGVFMLLDGSFLLSIICTITVFTGSLVGIFITFMQSRLNARKSSFYDLVRVLVFILSAVIFNFLWLNMPPLSRLLLSLTSSYLITIGLLLVGRYKLFINSCCVFYDTIKKGSFTNIFKNNKNLFRYGAPMALWLVVSNVLNYTDRYFIECYSTDYQLGVYSIVYDILFKIIALIFTPIMIAAGPIIVREFNSKNRNEIVSLVKKLIVLEVILFILILSSIIFLRDFFIEKILRVPASDEVVNLILPILLGSFFWQLAMLAHKPLELGLKTMTMLVFILLALIFNFTTNFIFIPEYGICAAAYTTLFSALFYLLLNLFFLRNFRIKKAVITY